MRVTKPIDATVDQLENAKETAVAMFKSKISKSAMDLFYTNNLEELETGIRQLNDFANKTWLLSALLLYSLIYDRELYKQSKLEWKEYAKQSRERLGLDPRDITEQLSAARFFIKNHKRLEKMGFEPVNSNRKLARAELALKLSKDINVVLKHLVNDTTREFVAWYQNLKPRKTTPKSIEYKRKDIDYRHGKFMLAGVEAVKISNDIPEDDKARLNEYITAIFEALARGYVPAIIQVYDQREAAHLERLRDKDRQGR